MVKRFPESRAFNPRIAEGDHPANLAAFVLSLTKWLEWRKHAVWALHGEVFIAHLKSAKESLAEEKYQDNYAGALMHRANGMAHMARHAARVGEQSIQLPCWREAKTVVQMAAEAVMDLRQSCTLRSAKYGSNGRESKSIFFAYQAALRNLADAMDIHAELTGTEAKQSTWCRTRADNLALGDKRILEACETGEELCADDRQRIERDLRIAMNAASDVPVLGGGQDSEMCSQCTQASATHIGFSCRCKCLCRSCATADGRVRECPMCGDFTEFVVA